MLDIYTSRHTQGCPPLRSGSARQVGAIAFNGAHLPRT